MIGENEILKNLDSIVIVKKDNKIVYTNKTIDLSELAGNKTNKKIVMANDGNEYEIVVYPSPSVKHYDSLTGLYSKGTFERETNDYYKSTLDSKEHFCAIFMDLDNFKKLNDTLGHLNADKILKIVASCIKKNIRSTDLCARFGGDEFVILLKSANLETSFRIAEQIRNKVIEINNEFQESEPKSSIIVSASIGIASSNSGDNLEEILNNADAALYQAKEQKGSIEVFDGGRKI